jgi:ADP-ribosyl-[dinitrogen reductase] hydrolase
MRGSIELCSRLAGGTWGHLVGDALGVPYEFRAPDAVGEIRFGEAGSHGQPAGTWSDDGALMLALLDSLTAVGFDPDDQGRRALAWRDDGAYTPDGDGAFDIGTTTSRGLRALATGTPAAEAGPTDGAACGNGSLMRILPLALVERDFPDAVLVEHAHAASRVTHGHPRCQVACALYALVVRALLAGAEPGDALAAARAALRATYVDDPAHGAALDELEAWTARTGSGFVLDAFWSAWDAFAGAASYEDAIERAIRYGHDTDTTAAIAGGLAGIRFGWEGIPVAWRTGMRGRDVVAPLLDRLLATAGAVTSSSTPLRVDLVEAADVLGPAGRLGITFLPGQKRDGWMGLRWRDADADAAQLRALGVDTLFLLVEDEEIASWCLVPEAPATIAGAGIDLVRFPVRDPRIPLDHAAFRAAIADLVERVRAGRFVAVACRGGLDRAPMTAACVLVEAGLDAEAAIGRVRAARGRAALTQPEQRAYVRGWGPRSGSAAAAPVA